VLTIAFYVVSTTRTSEPTGCRDNFPPKETEPTDHLPIPFFRQTVASQDLLLPLYLITLTTGLLDASTFSSFNVFASNQTGNAILLTLAAANSAPVEIHNTAASLGGFLLSALIAGRLGNVFGTRKRGWLLTSNTIQLVLLVTTTILTAPNIGIIHIQDRTKQWIVLFLLASSAGFQVSMAKTSGVQEIPTAMLTSPFVEFATDKALYKRSRMGPEVESRNRRAVYISCLMGGSLM
jgi:uncharacterized membrane protein YoaK (UPF0700 family)